MNRLEPLAHGRVGHQIAHAPARHGIGLGEALDDDHAAAHIRKRGKTVVVVRIDQLSVHLVAQNENRQLPQHTAEHLQGLGGIDAARGVVGRGQHHCPGPGGEGGAEAFLRDLKAIMLGGKRHRHTPAQPDDGFVEAESRRGDHHLIARVQNAEQADEQRLRRADGHDDLVRRVAQAVPLRLKARDSLPQPGTAAVFRVVGIVAVQRLLGCVLHALRRIQVRFPDRQQHCSRRAPCQRRKAPDAGESHVHHGAVHAQLHCPHAPFSIKGSIKLEKAACQRRFPQKSPVRWPAA